ncbi:putative oxidoreductase [Melioribacter roseus P3M-2]|uniref:Putative oxidoreductase n=1 Tax=Melioribacter roseus (strain DSM 23840 / JCM 17771 / VKM B-2668 / P3M-2) TaxID=1191523 RepID=I6ZT46_MELRP|nr:SDR family oxidoreductase [Melioribacter roseus]AFN75219.1 putative oxidoreductase [Melioribacter roseus P3M-2]
MKDSVTIITGASRGIGRAIAVRLAQNGGTLVLIGRDKNKLNETASIVTGKGGTPIIYAGDIANINFIDDTVKDVLNKFGKVDNLINNAGVAIFKKFVDVSVEEFMTQMNVNMYAVFNFTKAVVPSMIQNKRGTIINISSLAGKNPFVYGTTYAATKHALMGFTKSLMLELREYNIRVSAVCPGSVQTDMIVDTPVAPKEISKVLSPEDVAETVAVIIDLPQNALASEIEIRPTNPK